MSKRGGLDTSALSDRAHHDKPAHQDPGHLNKLPLIPLHHRGSSLDTGHWLPIIQATISLYSRRPAKSFLFGPWMDGSHLAVENFLDQAQLASTPKRDALDRPPLA